MAQLIDSEKSPLPESDSSAVPYFGIEIWDTSRKSGSGPTVVVHVPPYFETHGQIYDGCGVLTIPVESILEEYLAKECAIEGGMHVPAFASYLRDFADRIEAAANDARVAQVPSCQAEMAHLDFMKTGRLSMPLGIEAKITSKIWGPSPDSPNRQNFILFPDGSELQFNITYELGKYSVSDMWYARPNRLSPFYVKQDE